MVKIYNADNTKYFCEGYGSYFNHRYEIWEKINGYWGLRYWSSNYIIANNHWNKIKNETIKKIKTPWIDWEV